MTPTDKIQRLLLAGTILSTMAGLPAAAAGVMPLSGGWFPAGGDAIILAQAPPPDPDARPGEKRPPGEPKRPPAEPKKQPPPPAQSQPPARQAPPPPAPPPPAPPQTRPPAPPTPPPGVKVAPPPPPAPPVAPPAVERPAGEPKRPPAEPKKQPPPAVQERPAAAPKAAPVPPATQTAPPAPPPNAQERPAGEPKRPPGDQKRTPGEQKRPPGEPKSAPTPPAVQGQPPAVPGRPVAPPAAQTNPTAPNSPTPGVKGPPSPPAPAPTTPPAARTAPPAAPPDAPNAGIKGPPPPQAPGVVPNQQSAPLTPSGVPAPNAQQTRPIVPVTPGAGLDPQSSRGQPIRRVEDLRGERRETREGDRTIIREPDRTIIREGNQTIIRHSETDRFRYGAQDVRTERRGNDNVTIVVRPGGERIVTTVDENGFLLRRSRFMTDGREVIIIDNRPHGPDHRRGSGFGGFVVDLPPPVVRIPRDRYIVEYDRATPETLYETLVAPPVDRVERRYTLDEVRYSAPVRDRMSRVDLNTVTFDSGSWALAPDQVAKLAAVAAAINRAIQVNPSSVFLIEGYTDAVGNDVDNLSLSDRRAESVALVLTQQFNVPAENLSTQGYGEQYLKVQTDQAERANRRVAVRNITPLLTGQAQ